jgi:1,4-alpha-glucan branching enzyme
MKKLYSILILLTLIFSSQISWSQIITTSPSFPTESSEITITFDSSQESRLGTFSGDLYAHTGVFIEGSTDWQHVIGTWEDNSSQPQLTNKGNGIYELVITPNITDYYSVTNGEVVTDIALVFRSADGGSQTNDLTIEIFQEGLNVSFASPSDNTMVTKNQSFQVEVNATTNDNLTLFLDGVQQETTTTSEINTSIQTAITGTHELVAVATAGSEEARDTIHFFVREDVITEQIPAGIIPGINYIDNNTVTLALYAPNKEYIYVIGDITNWEINNTYQMKKDSDHFWITIDNLTPSKEYVFQYYIDGDIKIADPYADKLLDPWNDKYITDEVYPNLIAYPSDKTSEFASVFQTAQTNFTWDDSGFTMPDHDDLVIYELLIRDFTAAGDIKTVTDTLDYLQRLGINAIELMPFNEFEGNDSWGYNPAFYFAPDKAYGTKNDYKAFINECHKRGIAVIMDMVLNHSFGQSPFYRMYEEGGKPSTDNPWYNREHNFENTDAHWGADFNHESLETQKLIDRINTYWIDEYHIDGYRFDFTKGFSNTYHDSSDPWASNYDAARIHLLKRMADQIWAENDKAFISFEHLADNYEEKELAAYGIHLWGNANGNYSEATMGYNENGKSDLSWTSWKNREWVAPRLISYMESHDEERVMVKNLEYGNSFGDYNVKELPTALSRIETAGAIFFATPGPKMIWQFGELGYDISIDENGRTGRKPIKWDYLDDSNRLHLYQVFSALIKLKTQEVAFSSEDYNLNVAGALKHVEINHTDMDVRVIANFDVKAGTITPNFSKTGSWFDYFSGNEISVSDINMNVNLKAGEYRIYTTKPLVKPSIPTAPTASQLTISDDFKQDEVIKATYTYNDFNGDAEGNSIIQWYLADDQSGTQETVIQGANSLEYTISRDDVGRYVRFAVTPVATSGDILTGNKVYSDYSQQIDYATGIEDIVDGELSIYPNPVNDLLHLDNLKQVKRINLYNLSGKIIIYKHNPDSNEILDLSFLNQGIYIIVFDLEDGSQLTRKVIKQ